LTDSTEHLREAEGLDEIAAIGSSNSLEKGEIGIAGTRAPNVGDRFWGALGAAMNFVR
jgi:hypothetical protein